MKPLIKKKLFILATIYIFIFGLFIIAFSSEVSAASGYITGKTGIGYTGHVVVYKSASTSTPLTYSGKKAMISKNVYAPYLGSSGDYYKIQWGNSTGYVSKSKTARFDLYGSGATKLTTNKKVTFGTYSGYLAKGTYVIYVNSSSGKIKWAPFSSAPAPEEKWNDPYAYLSSL